MSPTLPYRVEPKDAPSRKGWADNCSGSHEAPATKAKKGTPKAVVEKGTPRVYEASDKPRLMGTTLEGIREPFTPIYKQSDLDDDEESDQESETPSEEKVVKKPKAKAKAKKKLPR